MVISIIVIVMLWSGYTFFNSYYIIMMAKNLGIHPDDLFGMEDISIYTICKGSGIVLIVSFAILYNLVVLHN